MSRKSRPAAARKTKKPAPAKAPNAPAARIGRARVFALGLLVLWPLLWLLSIPFRILGAVVEGMLAFVRAVFLFPARILGGR